jgi:polar amino acid transport system substrate-binding protein
MVTTLKHSIAALSVLAVAAALTGCSSSGKTDAGQAPAAVPVPASALIKPGQITFCSDISAPPLTFYDAQQKVVGAEAELGTALADQMGLSVKWANTAFNGIIPALQGRQCDAIVSQLYIKPEREKVVDFVPYMYAGNILVVAQNKATGITGPADLCGKKAAAQTGTTVAQYLQDQSNQQCTSAGKPKIETAAYVSKQQPGTFAMVGQPFNRIKVGAATLKNNGALHDALGKALAAVQQNGQYESILKKWDLTGDSLS